MEVVIFKLHLLIRSFLEEGEDGHFRRVESRWRGRCRHGASLPLSLTSLNLGRRSARQCAGSVIRSFRFQMMRPEDNVRVLLKEEGRESFLV